MVNRIVAAHVSEAPRPISANVSLLKIEDCTSISQAYTIEVIDAYKFAGVWQIVWF